MSAIYIHIPFCTRKCLYCSFFSKANTKKVDEYLIALAKEIQIQSKYAKLLNPIKTIYFGGGTPSILSSAQIAGIFDSLRQHFDLSSRREVTIEVNPSTVDIHSLSDYLSIGINRLSIGVQSCIDSELKLLGRTHSAEEALSTIATAQEAGFTNISADIIYSLPNQSKENIKYSIDKLNEANVSHISAYTLSYEPGTYFYKQLEKGNMLANSEDEEEELYLYLCEYLDSLGFTQYEISSYCRNGQKSQHNLAYWSLSDYLGLGASAHSFLAGKRMSNVSSIEKYNEALSNGTLPTDFREKPNEDESLTEALFLGLRAEGLNLKDVKDRFAHDILATKQKEMKYVLDGRGRINGDILHLTPRGYAVCDYITRLLDRY